MLPSERVGTRVDDGGRAGLTVPRFVLCAAAVVFIVLGWTLSDAVGTWHEELSVHPTRGYEVLEAQPGGGVSVVRTCGDGRALVTAETRPRWSLCALGFAMPIMVESYFTGIFYWPMALAWPIHQGDAFRLRKLWLLLGVVDLILAFVLVSRLRDPSAAAVVVSVIAVSSPFVYIHTLLVHYEVLPWTFSMAAMIALGPVPMSTAPRRVLTAVALVGLGTLANVKMLLLVAPFGAMMLLRHRAWLSAHSVRTRLLAVLTFATTTAPAWVFAIVDPSHGLGEQVGRRVATFVRHLDPRLLPAEIVNQLSFGADVGMFLSNDSVAHPAVLVPGALASAWAVWHLVRWLRRRDADPVAVLCGATLVSYLLVSMLLYEQTPSANYSPLDVVFGLTMGGAIVAAGRVASARTGWTGGRRRDVPAALIAALFMAAMCAYHVWRMERLRATTLPINIIAQHELARHLRDGPGTPVVSTTYAQAGVIESLGRGRVHAIQAHALVDACLDPAARAAPDGCLEQVFTRTLDAVPRDASFLVPTRASVVDEPGVEGIVPAMRAVATARRRHLRKVAGFAGPDGVELFALYRFDAD